MILGIMQPYFFPHLGYFDLINYSDEWIVFDSVQYIRKGWMNRNRILCPNKGWQYFSVPIKKQPRETKIKNTLINNQTDWKQKIFSQVAHYKNKSPYYHEVKSLLGRCFDGDLSTITELNYKILTEICSFVRIKTEIKIFSKMNLEINDVSSPGDWALLISKKLAADEYVNPPGGEFLFNKSAFSKNNIRLTIRDIKPMQYNPVGFDFIPRLSVIDVLMWNSPEKVLQYINES